jgi:hypothetical protein
MAAGLILAPIVSGPARAQEPTRAPMPVDIPPHHRGFIAGERHFDVSNAPPFVRHFGDHFISYGRHNYDISDDPAYSWRYPFETVRFRGTGRGLERMSVVTWHPDEFDLPPERPWVSTGMRARGLRYRPPEEQRVEPPPFDRPTPSYYAVYKQRPAQWEKALQRWDRQWVPGRR